MKLKSLLWVTVGVLLLCMCIAVVPVNAAGDSWTFVTKWGTGGEPPGVAVNSSGYVYVTDIDNNTVQVFGSDGTYVTKWGSLGAGDGQFHAPFSIDVDATGNVTVVDLGNNRTQVFGPSGEFIGKWGSYGTGDGQFAYPFGVAVNSSGYIYVSEAGNHRIQVFSGTGAYVTKWGSLGGGNGQFYQPRGIAVNSSDYVYVADSENDRVQVFTSDGTYVTQWGSLGAGDGDFDTPYDIAVGASDEIYVADRSNHRIQEFTLEGTYVTQWGSQWGTYGSGPGQLHDPIAIAMSPGGNLYVADFYNYRVQEFSQNLPSGPASQALFRNNLNRTGDYSCPNCTSPPPTNNLKWKFTAPDVIHGSPTVSNGIVYFGCNDTKVYALNANTGSEIWNYTAGGMVQSSPAVADGVVYIGSDDGHLYALNATTGVEIWANFSGSYRVRSSPVVAYGNVYVGSDNQMIMAINTTTGLMAWANTTGGEIYSSPVVLNGVVYFGSYDGFVYAVEAMTGKPVWTYYTRGNPVLSTPAIYNNSVYIGGWDYDIYALDASTGSMIWNWTTGASVQSSPAVANGIVYIGSNDQKVYALDANTKSELWNFDTGGMVYSSPAYADGVIYVGSYDNKVYALDASTGSELWNYTTGSYVYSSPAVADGIVYFGSWDHSLYALGGAPTTGDLTVTSSPSGATIFLDGPDTGLITPNTTYGLSQGYHHVNVTLSGYYPQEKSVYVTGGTTTSVDFPMEATSTPTGFLYVVSNVTGAWIYVDGVNTTSTTPYNVSGYLSNHTVTLVYPGYFNATRSVNIPSDSTLEAFIQMNPIPPEFTGGILENVTKIIKDEVDDNVPETIVDANPSLLAASTTLDFRGDQSPVTSPASDSTAVFIDPDPKANGDHPCKLVFIDVQGEKTVIDVMSQPKNLAVQKVQGLWYDAAGDNLNLVGSRESPSTGGGLSNLTSLTRACTNTPCSDNNYAVLIDGGYNTSSNHIRYWNDISFMYQTLNKTYGYPQDRIQVLMSDGADNKSVDRHNWTFANGSILVDDSPSIFDGGMWGSRSEVTGAADRNNLTVAFSPAKIPPGKNIFVFMTGHGGLDASGNAIYYLWNQQYISAADFVEQKLPADAASITMVVEQCYSGGFVRPFMESGRFPSNMKRMIATASSATQPSKDNGFSSTWIMAAAKIDRNENPALLADLPAGAGNKQISFSEASDYAKNNDPYKDVETSQYSSTLSDGTTWYLYTTCTAGTSLKLSSPSNGDNWCISFKRNVTWGQIGYDTLSNKKVNISLWNNQLTTRVLDITPLCEAAQQPVYLNKSFCRWIIPPTLTAGQYKLRINTSLTDYETKSLYMLAKPPSTPTPTQGRVNINSSPWKDAEIWADGVKLIPSTVYKTNYTLSEAFYTSPGTHIYGLTKSGKVPVEGKFNVSSNNGLIWANFTLWNVTDNGYGMMVITSSPASGTVYVNGVSTGQQTPYSAQYAPDIYAVSVKGAFGYTDTTDQPVRIFNNPASAHFELTPEPWLYTLDGFYAPIDMGGIVNSAKAGQTVPVKWHLSDPSGNDVSSLPTFNLYSYRINCDDYSQMTEEEIGDAPGNSGLQYLGSGNWQYNWKTAKSYKGQCRMMYIVFGDSLDHALKSPEVIFRFR